MLTAQDLPEVSPLIEGRSVTSASDARFSVYNPASGKLLTEIPRGCSQDVDAAVAAARRAFDAGVWRGMPPSVRKTALHKWANLILSNASRLDALDALEMGKPVSLTVANATTAAGLAHFNAEALDKITGEVLSADAASTVIQSRRPRGVVAAVVPWNFPTFNAVLKTAPALAAGNCVVLKPSELASQSALLLAWLALEAGLPPGVLNVVPGCGESVGKALGQHMDVNMLTFTGSSQVGKLMLQYAGQSNMKLISAECGGKSPQIVFDDGVNVDVAADSIAAMLRVNQGQLCSVGSRLLVQETIEEDLVQKITARLERTSPGDPQVPQTDYGPLVSQNQFNRVMSFITAGIREGADLVQGGGRLLEHTGGYFVEPTVFVNVPEKSPIALEEIFGPVLAVLRFRDADDAIRLAKTTFYGLAAYVWSAKTATGFKLANALPTAYTMINAVQPTGEGPGHAFSGEPSGLSGLGVEGGVAGLETYLRRQTVCITHG